ncbi:unnamed protein product [Vitrella brassicaformis CCMP3155]|uniref:Uncharacterized protein n=1 Tax=Vitrella brassicaformis (strain CCMP3155) TaxID=1169540 RepID=A0A0G4G066_VITBC|nr:unnamed protein product [Vitrella brassicaformis CCMP3155]|eukprot:CEM21235.1 unnamed protein product [Vitrella brassicaformis CCMP3155]
MKDATPSSVSELLSHPTRKVSSPASSRERSRSSSMLMLVQRLVVCVWLLTVPAGGQFARLGNPGFRTSGARCGTEIVQPNDRRAGKGNYVACRPNRFVDPYFLGRRWQQNYISDNIRGKGQGITQSGAAQGRPGPIGVVRGGTGGKGGAMGGRGRRLDDGLQGPRHLPPVGQGRTLRGWSVATRPPWAARRRAERDRGAGTAESEAVGWVGAVQGWWDGFVAGVVDVVAS